MSSSSSISNSRSSNSSNRSQSNSIASTNSFQRRGPLIVGTANNSEAMWPPFEAFQSNVSRLMSQTSNPAYDPQRSPISTTSASPVAHSSPSFFLSQSDHFSYEYPPIPPHLPPNRLSSHLISPLAFDVVHRGGDSASFHRASDLAPQLATDPSQRPPRYDAGSRRHSAPTIQGYVTSLPPSQVNLQYSPVASLWGGRQIFSETSEGPRISEPPPGPENPVSNVNQRLDFSSRPLMRQTDQQTNPAQPISSVGWGRSTNTGRNIMSQSLPDGDRLLGAFISLRGGVQYIGGAAATSATSSNAVQGTNDAPQHSPFTSPTILSSPIPPPFSPLVAPAQSASQLTTSNLNSANLINNNQTINYQQINSDINNNTRTIYSRTRYRPPQTQRIPPHPSTPNTLQRFFNNRPGILQALGIDDLANEGLRYSTLNLDGTGRAQQEELSQGVPKEILEILPQHVCPLDDPNEVTTDLETRTCSVCQLDYTENELVRRLPCLHLFHSLCIDKWLESHRSCPVCRIGILEGLERSGLDEADLHLVSSHLLRLQQQQQHHIAVRIEEGRLNSTTQRVNDTIVESSYLNQPPLQSSELTLQTTTPHEIPQVRHVPMDNSNAGGDNQRQQIEAQQQALAGGGQTTQQPPPSASGPLIPENQSVAATTDRRGSVLSSRRRSVQISLTRGVVPVVSPSSSLAPVEQSSQCQTNSRQEVVSDIASDSQLQKPTLSQIPSSSSSPAPSDNASQNRDTQGDALNNAILSTSGSAQTTLRRHTDADIPNITYSRPLPKAPPPRTVPNSRPTPAILSDPKIHQKSSHNKTAAPTRSVSPLPTNNAPTRSERKNEQHNATLTAADNTAILSDKEPVRPRREKLSSRSGCKGSSTSSTNSIPSTSLSISKLPKSHRPTSTVSTGSCSRNQSHTCSPNQVAASSSSSKCCCPCFRDSSIRGSSESVTQSANITAEELPSTPSLSKSSTLVPALPSYPSSSSLQVTPKLPSYSRHRNSHCNETSFKDPHLQPSTHRKTLTQLQTSSIMSQRNYPTTTRKANNGDNSTLTSSSGEQKVVKRNQLRQQRFSNTRPPGNDDSIIIMDVQDSSSEDVLQSPAGRRGGPLESDLSTSCLSTTDTATESVPNRAGVKQKESKTQSKSTTASTAENKQVNSSRSHPLSQDRTPPHSSDSLHCSEVVHKERRWTTLKTSPESPFRRLLGSGHQRCLSDPPSSVSRQSSRIPSHQQQQRRSRSRPRVNKARVAAIANMVEQNAFPASSKSVLSKDSGSCSNSSIGVSWSSAQSSAEDAAVQTRARRIWDIKSNSREKSPRAGRDMSSKQQKRSLLGRETSCSVSVFIAGTSVPLSKDQAVQTVQPSDGDRAVTTGTHSRDLNCLDDHVSTSRGPAGVEALRASSCHPPLRRSHGQTRRRTVLGQKEVDMPVGSAALFKDWTAENCTFPSITERPARGRKPIADGVNRDSMPSQPITKDSDFKLMPQATPQPKTERTMKSTEGQKRTSTKSTSTARPRRSSRGLIHDLSEVAEAQSTLNSRDGECMASTLTQVAAAAAAASSSIAISTSDEASSTNSKGKNRGDEAVPRQCASQPGVVKKVERCAKDRNLLSGKNRSCSSRSTSESHNNSGHRSQSCCPKSPVCEVSPSTRAAWQLAKAFRVVATTTQQYHQSLSSTSSSERIDGASSAASGNRGYRLVPVTRPSTLENRLKAKGLPIPGPPAKAPKRASKVSQSRSEDRAGKAPPLSISKKEAKSNASPGALCSGREPVISSADPELPSITPFRVENAAQMVASFLELREKSRPNSLSDPARQDQSSLLMTAPGTLSN